jgi:mono/diheme cytochrome c family protein
MWRIPAVTMVFIVQISSASAAGDPESGRLLTQRWCSGCHAVPSARSASDAAPSFASVAKAHKDDPSWVRVWLMAPHPPMEGINLSRQQIDDVIAYLQSLSPRTDAGQRQGGSPGPQ